MSLKTPKFCLNLHFQPWILPLPLPTLCNLMDCGLPDSSVHGINQARILEWVVTQWYSIKWFSKCCLETNVSLSFEVQCSQLTITVIVESYCPSTKKMQ